MANSEVSDRLVIDLGISADRMVGVRRGVLNVFGTLDDECGDSGFELPPTLAGGFV